MRTLFINACVRPGSRTKRLAEHLLARLGGSREEVLLEKEGIRPLTNEDLEKREELLSKKEYDAPMLRYARGFRDADRIVIAAPHWDLSFPASLKAYIEQICAVGVTFDYNENGQPYGLCRAKELYFVTTSGGPILSDEPGYGYIKLLTERFFGIPETVCIKAEGLDVIGADIEGILEEAEREIDRLVIPE